MSGGEAPAPRQGRLRSVFGNLGWLLASNGLMAVLSLIYVAIVTRTLGIADFGRFALIIGAAQTLATLVSFETWKIVVQYGVEHGARGDHAAVLRIGKAAMLMEAASAVAGTAVLTLMFTLWPEPFGIEADLRPYAIGYALVQLVTLRSTPTGILRLNDKFNLGAVAESTQPVMRMAGALLALFFSPDIQGFLLAYAVAEVLTWAMHWVMAARVTDIRALLGTPFRRRKVLAENFGLLRFMWSTNVQMALGLASRQAPLLLVGGYAGPSAAGAFRLALQLANALSKISTLIIRAAFPELVRSIRSISHERFRWLVRRILLSGFAGGAVVMLLVVLLGHELLTLIGGRDFGAGYVMLLWLAGAGSVELAAASLQPILQTLHRAGTVMLARIAAVALQALALLLLLPAFGALGAAMSVLLGSVLTALFMGAGLAHYTNGREQAHSLAEESGAGTGRPLSR